MFDRLSDGFSSVLRKLSGKGAISESNVREAMEQVRTALLEADVALEVVNSFTEGVLKDALGREVTKSLNPGQEMIGIVYDRLVQLLGDLPEVPAGASQEDIAKMMMADGPGVAAAEPGPTIVMMCGLQGSGKTTTCGKLAGWLKKRGRSVMLVAADLQRPAAVDQLQTVAEQVQRDLPGGATVTFYSEPEKTAEYGKAVGVAVGVCERAVAKARSMGVDTVILDTAGRLHVNDQLMDELKQVNLRLKPHQIFLVVDAMTGQDAVRSAKSFHEKLEVDGLIFTKFDSDTRGGAALSVKSITGAKIRFVGVGEKLDAIEEFHPVRVAGRILGMGDVVSLVQKAREQVSEEDAKALEEKLAKGEMTLEDFLNQLRSLRRMGPMKQLLGLLPGIGSALKNINIEDEKLDRVEGIIHSMTKDERRKPELLNSSRRRRIAKGSGTSENEVAALVKQFTTISQISKQMAGMSALDKMKAVKQLGAAGQGPMLPSMGSSFLRNKGTSYTPSIKDRFKKRK
ncbi:MAG: signal recognition particle protein [Phycisphaerales bacterium]|nr:signal recognition particle protein [Phycisphaerales bacterium]